VLQALSKRIHLGKFVAEAKFNDPSLRDKYVELIQQRDSDGLLALLTNSQVEDELLERVLQKASVYCHEMQIGPQVIRDIYREFVIPMTKQVEVDYLLQRLD
jgi:chorismate mutase